MNKKLVGILAIFLAALMWAIEPIFVKLSYEHSSVFETSAIRALLVMIIALLYLAFQKTSPFSLKKNQLYPLLYIAIAGTLLADFLYYYALIQASVLNAVLLGHMQPVFIIIIGYFFLQNETLSTKDYLGVFFMMMSAIMVSTGTFENALRFEFIQIADALVLIATIAWASAAIAVRKYLTNLSAGVITFYRFFFATIFFSGYFLVLQSFHLHWYQVAVGVIVGVGTLCYYEALKRLKAAQVSSLELASPLLAAFLGLLILNESITVLQLIGLVLLFIGVYFFSAKEHKTS